MTRRMHSAGIVMLTIVCAGAATGCKSRSKKTGDGRLPYDRDLAQLTVTVQSEDQHTVYLYLDHALQGTAPLGQTIYVEGGAHRVLAVVPTRVDSGAFYIVERQIALTDKQRSEVLLSIPARLDLVPALATARQMMRSLPCPNPGAVAAAVRANADDIARWNDDVDARIRDVQSDSLFRQLTAIDHDFLTAPPSVNRLPMRGVPVWSSEARASIDLTLTGQQIQHLASWLAAQRFRFGWLENRINNAADELKKVGQWGYGCGDPRALEIVTPSYNAEEQRLYQVKFYRDALKNAAASVSKQLEQADRSPRAGRY